MPSFMSYYSGGGEGDGGKKGKVKTLNLKQGKGLKTKQKLQCYGKQFCKVVGCV